MKRLTAMLLTLALVFSLMAVPAAQASYTVEARPVKTEQPLLGSAQVTARSASGRELFEVTVCWQEGLDG